MNLMLINVNASVFRKQKNLKSLLLWKISMVCFVKWYERLTSSDSHDNIETESEDNSIVALPCEICDELCPSDKLMEHQEQSIQEREAIQRSGSASEKNVCTQAILLTSGSGDSINVFEITAVKVKP